MTELVLQRAGAIWTRLRGLDAVWFLVAAGTPVSAVMAVENGSGFSRTAAST